MSRALTVKEKLPDCNGVPAIRPEALRDNPRGSAPAATLQLEAPVPPVAASVTEYGVAICACGSTIVSMVTEATTATFAAALVVVRPLLSVAAAVRRYVPGAMWSQVIVHSPKCGISERAKRAAARARPAVEHRWT